MSTGLVQKFRMKQDINYSLQWHLLDWDMSLTGLQCTEISFFAVQLKKYSGLYFNCCVCYYSCFIVTLSRFFMKKHRKIWDTHHWMQQYYTSASMDEYLQMKKYNIVRADILSLFCTQILLYQLNKNITDAFSRRLVYYVKRILFYDHDKWPSNSYLISYKCKIIA